MQKINPESFLKQAIDTFTNINDRINSLIDCSALDFDILNQGFQHYYLKIKELTTNTDVLFQNNIELANRISQGNSNNLNKIQPELNSSFTSTIDTSRELTLIIKELSYLFLHINNLKQNINTLKLITTNMKIEPKYNKTYDELIDLINNLLHCSHHFDQELKNTESKLTKCSDILNKICTYQFPAFIETYQDHVSVLSKFSLSKTLWLDYDNSIKQLIAKNTSSSAEIITNLQFQDIIRQKIEHVQETQDALLDKLKHFKGRDSKTINDDNKLLHILFQIRNIGSLQAAQLVHANNEYQTSVDTITSRFEELDYILIETLNIIQGIAQQPIKNKSFPISELIESNLKLEKKYTELNNLGSELEHLYTEIFREDNILSQSSENLSCAIDNCKTLIQKIQQHKNKLTTTNNIDPLQQLLDNFKAFRSNSDETHRTINQNQQRIKKTILPGLEYYFSSSLKFDKTFKKHFATIKAALEDIPSTPNTLQLQLTEIDINEIKFNSHKLNYYNVFDKEIEDIISKINTLCNEIDFTELEKNYNDTDIKDLQKLYTMNSEREIHSSITGDDFESDNNNDDIELF